MNSSATTGHLNNLMAMVGNADHGTDNKRCDDAMSLFREYEKQWSGTAQILDISMSNRLKIFMKRAQ